MVEKKETITTASTTSTRVHAGVALVTIGGLALASFGFFWVTLSRLHTETNRSANQSAPVIKNETREEKTATLTRQLFTLNDADQSAAVADRRAALLTLAEQDPRTAQGQVVSSTTAAKLSAAAQAGIEKEVTVSGELEVIIADDLEQRTTRHDLYLRQGETRRRIFAPNAGAYASLSGKNVTVKGFQIDESHILLSADGTTESLTADSTTDTTIAVAANKNALIILFNFANDTRQPLTADDARNRIFGASNSVGNFVKEGSFNAVGLSGKVRTDGDVLGYFTLPSTYNSSTQTCSTYYRTWSDAARVAATEAGNDLSGYSNFFYIFPRPSSACPGWSWAEIVGDEAWINDFKIPTLAHEHGHNLGAPHSSTYICRDASGLPTTLSTNCTIDEYGDPFDIMGGGPLASYYHYNNVHKNEAGWLPTANVQDITASGTYTIQPIERSTTGPQALRIARNKNSSGLVSEHFWLEYRQPYGFDSFTSSDPVANGVSFRLAPAQTSTGYVAGNLSWNTLLLDMTPSTSTFSDAPLAVGQVFEDPTFGLRFETVAVSAESATITITMTGPTCTAAAPTVTLQSAAGTYGGSGQGLVYYLNVTNNDNSACPTSTFEVTPTVPAGWTQTPTPISFTLAPGAFRQTAITVTSDSGAVPEVYTFSEVVRNTTTDRSTTVTGSYTVTGPDLTAPTVTISSPADNSTIRGKTIKIKASANDASGIGTIEILIDSVVKKTCSLTTVCALSTTMTAGRHSITARATDRSANANVATKIINVTKK